MNPTWLRTLVVVIEEGSINRAATILGIAQPALSRQVRSLEALVGGPLLERSTRGVLPTPAGDLLARRGRALLEAIESTLDEVRAVASGGPERVRLGTLQSLVQSLVSPALASLRKGRAAVRVGLVDLSPGEQVRALREGRIDVALVGQEGAVLAKDFYAKTVARFPLAAVLPPAHPLAGNRSVSLRELRVERFVMAPEDDVPGRNRWLGSLARKAGFRATWGPVSETVADLFQRVAEEGFVALVPGYLARVAPESVTLVPLVDPGAQWDLLVAWRRGRAGPGIKALVDALAARAVILAEEVAIEATSRVGRSPTERVPSRSLGGTRHARRVTRPKRG